MAGEPFYSVARCGDARALCRFLCLCFIRFYLQAAIMVVSFLGKGKQLALLYYLY
jgi:hypothetical protein